MENVKPSYTSLAAKWAVIYLVTSIVITYLFQYANVDQASPAKYLSYIPFIAFLLLAQKEYKDKLGGFITFGEGFMAGFIYAVFSSILLAIFMYVYFSFLSPQVWEQVLSTQKDQMAQRNMSPEQVDQAMSITRKYGPILTAVGVVFVVSIVGAIISLIGAAIFKKERSVSDIEGNSDSYVDPSV